MFANKLQLLKHSINTDYRYWYNLIKYKIGQPIIKIGLIKVKDEKDFNFYVLVNLNGKKSKKNNKETQGNIRQQNN